MWMVFGRNQTDSITSLRFFFYHNEVDIEKARELLMTISNLFLIAINENERIRPYLGKYPFKLENLLIDIFFKNSDGSELGQEQLHVAALGEGTLQYMISCSATERLRTIQIETYKEAEAKLAAVAKRASHQKIMRHLLFILIIVNLCM